MANFTTSGSDTYPTGMVLQTQYIYQSSSYSNTGGYSTILTDTITPSATGNPIYIHIGARTNWPDGTSSHGWCPCRVQRASTTVGGILYTGDDTPQNYKQSWLAWNFVDTGHNTSGSAVTYTWQGSSDYGLNFQVFTAHMTLQELKG